MSDRVIIAVKKTKEQFVKVRSPLHGDPPTPIVGFSYSCCNIITSSIVAFEPISGGWRVRTENSTYEFFLGTIEYAQEIASKLGLEGPQHRKPTDISLSFYWREQC
jgi:hypothetical protein